MFLQTNHELDFFATVESRVPTLPYPEANQSSSNNVSSFYPCVQQSMDELGHDLYMRRTTAHDHLVLQKPRDDLIEWIMWSFDRPAAS